MILRHATPRQNLDSIMASGLLPSKATSPTRKASWFHSQSKTAWAILHTQARKGKALGDLVVLDMNVPRAWLTRYQTGLWYCTRAIGPERIISVTEATAYAASPVQE